MQLTGKRFLITGASAGIGAEVARAIASKVQDAQLVLAARREGELEALARDVRARGATAAVVACDLASSAGADALAEAAVVPFGGIDVLVNNAGTELVGAIWKDGIADAGDRLMQLNLMSPLRLTHRLLPAMMSRGEGAVVMMSSLAGWAPMPGGSYYGASKGALARASETIRIELKGTGVRVLAVYPGPVKTRLLDDIVAQSGGRFIMPGMPVGRADALARRVVEALRKDEESLFYPSVYAASTWFMSVSRWLVKLSTPARKRA